MKKIVFCSAMALNIISGHCQDYALQQLENSPRHHEWIEVKNGDRSMHCFVAYPEKSENTLAVVVIHENRGLNTWARSFADQVAAAGYLAIAPDLLSGFDEKHRKTTDFESSDAARDAIYKLDAAQVTADLRAVIAYAKEAPASTGKVVVAGFCWGGSQSFRIATNSGEIAAAMVFYGSAPENRDDLARISVPVYGFYGENDQRINSGIPGTEAAMKELGKKYDYVIYPGAGHAYMRQGDDPNADEASKEARDDSWDRLEKILSGLSH